MRTGLISLRRSPAFGQVTVTVAITGQFPSGQFGVMLRASPVRPRYMPVGLLLVRQPKRSLLCQEHLVYSLRFSSA
jgi:hypothetical protein